MQRPEKQIRIVFIDLKSSIKNRQKRFSKKIWKNHEFSISLDKD